MRMAISKHPVGVDVDDIAIDDVDFVDDVVVDNEDYHIQTSRQPSLCSLEGETPFWWHSDIAPAWCWWSNDDDHGHDDDDKDNYDDKENDQESRKYALRPETQVFKIIYWS